MLELLHFLVSLPLHLFPFGLFVNITEPFELVNLLFHLLDELATVFALESLGSTDLQMLVERWYRNDLIAELALLWF